MALGKVSGQYSELARFIRNFMEAHEWDVKRLSLCLWPITETRLYDITKGRRTFDGWEVALFHKRTGVLIPAPYLRGEDKYGRVTKQKEPSQTKMDALLAEAEKAWDRSL